MALAAGTRIGPYEIQSALGAGGMGEVFRARDVRLGREVAVKVVPELFANDPERVARFAREAQLLAALNHPNIASIYGFEETPSVKALVLELVEGPTLADRLAQGPVSLEDSLAIAKQLVDALEAAHEKGIIHRDLKPANIKLRPDGTVKVLDFGLAKALDSNASSEADAMTSPTLTARATQMGVILGTAAYMAPEQAKGRAVDKRADIWAFGCVLYEMLTGRRAFEGEDISDTLAFVITKEPDWTALPASLPPSLRRLLRRCLEKDRKRRLADIADARLEIEEASFASSNLNTASAGYTRPSRVSRVLSWTLTAALGAGLAAAAGLWAPWRREAARTPLRLSAEIGADFTLERGLSVGSAVALSPDGTLLALVAKSAAFGQPALHVRRLDEWLAAPLSGTDGAAAPFFSPDGQWIAFFAGGRLRKIPTAGGAAVTLAEASDPRGGSWSEDDTIVFAPERMATLLRVSSADGQPVPLMPAAEGEAVRRWPQVLPGAKALLYTSHRATGDFDAATLVVQLLPEGAPKVLLQGGYHGLYVHSGHLLFVREGTLFAVPFDLNRLELAGPSVPVVKDVMSSTLTGTAHFTVSNEGTLAYVPATLAATAKPLLWMDVTGAMNPLGSVSGLWESLDFSPDGRRLALDMYDGKQWDIWVYEWPRDTLSRLTFDGRSTKPVWTPDGRRVVFTSRSGGRAAGSLYWQRADGVGKPQQLVAGDNTVRAGSWHPSRRFLAISELNLQTNWDLMILTVDGDEVSGWKPGKPTVFLNGPFIEVDPMFSPDGKWLAYHSNESGRHEVYVRPFPGPGARVQLSSGGGANATWSPARHEVCYATDNGQMMVVPYSTTGDVFNAGKPRLWSPARFTARLGSTQARSLDLHPDGVRFAVAGVGEADKGATHEHVALIFNFFDELRRIAPPDKR